MPAKHHDMYVSIGTTQVVPKDWEVGLQLGHTVRYLPDVGTGTLTIRFKEEQENPDKSPFIGLDGEPMMTVVGGTFVTIAREGEFKCGCIFTFAKDGRKIGWDKNKPDATEASGGSHNVPDKRKNN